MDKQGIANQIKSISIDDVEKEMNKLIEIGKNSHTIGPRSRIGNNIIDYYTFVHRLETRGKYNISFLIFLRISTSSNKRSLFKPF